MNPITKTVEAAVRSLADTDPGSFEMILSDDSTDRDGDNLYAYDWRHPLPDSIPLKANHSRDVADIVGSGEPFIDSNGALRVRGVFASTPLAQQIRTLVTERHLQSVSVEFLRHADGTAELVGGAFVDVPSNPRARVLAAKSLAPDGGKMSRLEEMRAAADAAYKNLAAGKIDEKTFDAVMSRIEKDFEAERVTSQNRRKALKYAGSADSAQHFAASGGAGAARKNKYYRLRAGEQWCAPASVMSASAEERWADLFVAAKNKATFSTTIEGAGFDGPQQPTLKMLGGRSDLVTKSPTGEGVAGGDGSLLPALLLPDAFEERLEPTRVFSQFPGVRSEGQWVQYLQHTSNANPAAAVAELGAIPDVGMNIVPQQTVFTKIAGMCTFSRELLDDHSEFMSFVPSELSRAVINQESAFVLSNSNTSDGWSPGLFNTSGVQTLNANSVDSPIDAVVTAAAMIRSATESFGVADLVLINPYSWLALRTLKAGTGNGLYVLDQFNPNALGQETFGELFGMKVVQSAQVPAGQAIVTDSSISTVAFTRQGMEVMSNWAGDTEFSEYSWSFRAVERIGIGVIWPQAIVIVNNLPTASGWSS